MTKLYLQNIVDDISFENLPIQWQGFDFSRFSKDKTLFDFQQNALKNALRGLWLFFKGNTPSELPFYEGVSGEPDGVLYHRPLLLTLVNSVSVEDSDLELFFRELEKVAKNEIRADLLKKAKDELVKEFCDTTTFLFEDLECVIDTDLISKLNYKDILKYVLNANTPGKIEVLKIPGNRQELIFRLMTADCKWQDTPPCEVHLRDW